MHKPCLPVIFASVVSFTAFISALTAQPAQTSSTAPDLSGTTDASIRSVLEIVSKHQIQKLADGDYTPRASIAALETARAPEGISWNYPWGVTLYGVIRASDFLNDKSALDFALRHNDIVARDYAYLADAAQKIGPETADWKKFLANRDKLKIGGLMRLGHLDSCGAMGVQFIEGMLRQPERITPAHRAVVGRIADWVVNKQERLPDGTFWREKSTDGDKGFDIAPQWPAGTIWIDDLYMGGTFLVRWSQLTGDPKYLDHAARQIIHMAALVQDKKDGLWFHAYSIPLKKHSPVKWGRANGWAMVSTIEALSVMPENHPLRPQLLGILRRHIDGIKTVQAPSGMWRQVLDDPALWEETSCTAMFAYSIARAANRGWIPASNLAVARKAFAAICANYITPDGKVNGTCRGTNIGQDVAYYANRPRPDDELHGRGVVLLAGAEILASSATPARINNSAQAFTSAQNNIIAIMRKVADWQLANPYRPASTNPHKSTLNPAGWVQAAGYTGVAALAQLTYDGHYYEILRAISEKNNWKPAARIYDADDHCVSQTYIDLYQKYKDPRMIAPTIERFDYILAHPKQTSLQFDAEKNPQHRDRWSWCDSLYMAPPAWMKLYTVTGNKAYRDFTVDNWWLTSAHLYDTAENLYYRDDRFVGDNAPREANGRKIFWSRGNGWVMGGLVRVLQQLPADDPARPRFEQQFKQMAAAVIACQQSDGLWRASMLDPQSYPLKETSGSGFFCYAFAWGMNNNLLDRATYEKPTLKCWQALVACLTPEGKLTHVQPVGFDPKNFPDDSTEAYGSGAFLLAGSEICKLIGQK